MAYTDDYVKVNWINKPSTNTPINQTNLNHAEQGIKNNCQRVANLSTTKAEQSDLLTVFKSVAFDSTTGTFTFTKFDNTTVTINTDLEKLAVNFDYDDDPTSPHYQNLVITLSDGTIKYADLSALVTQYEFTNTSTISFTIAAGGEISANVIDGSITESKLQPNFLADCREAKTDAETAANSAEADGLVSEGYAKGTQNGIAVGPGSPYYENNAEYFKNRAAQIVNQSLAGLNDVQITNPQEGDALVYDSTTQKWVNGPSGGIAPQNVVDLSATPGNAKITLKWSDPGDTVIDGVTICKWQGTKVVMKAGAYPSSITDGTLVVDNTVLDQYKTSGYEVTGLTNGTTYYFQLFPYSDTGATNKDVANRISETPAANVTVTLTLNGAKEDSITIFDSNNTQVGSCVFASGQTSGTAQIVVVGGGGSYKFVSSVAKGTTLATLANDYEKTVTLTDQPTQTVDVMPDNLYWYGNNKGNFHNGTWAGVNLINPTFNTNSMNFTYASSGYKRSLSMSDAVDLSGYTKLKVVMKGTNTEEGACQIVSSATRDIDALSSHISVARYNKPNITIEESTISLATDAIGVKLQVNPGKEANLDFYAYILE